MGIWRGWSYVPHSGYMKPILSFLRHEEGQDLIEYTLLMAFIALASAAIFINAGSSVNGIWQNSSNQLGNAAAMAKLSRAIGVRHIQSWGKQSPCEDFSSWALGAAASSLASRRCPQRRNGLARLRRWPGGQPLLGPETGQPLEREASAGRLDLGRGRRPGRHAESAHHGRRRALRRHRAAQADSPRRRHREIALEIDSGPAAAGRTGQ